MTFQNYLVKDGQAGPENPFDVPHHDAFPHYKDFETWKQSHTYATDAKDGIWSVERFDIVWQYEIEGEPGFWFDYKDQSVFDGSYARYRVYMIEEMNCKDTRQFAKFKEEVEKPKERKIHYLKTWQPYFDNVKEDKKKFEVRKNDRDYQVGDLVILKEYDHVNKTYTDRSIQKEIIYILQGGSFGIEPGYCVLQLL